jgi:hypothetical protein
MAFCTLSDHQLFAPKRLRGRRTVLHENLSQSNAAHIRGTRRKAARGNARPCPGGHRQEFMRTGLRGSSLPTMPDLNAGFSHPLVRMGACEGTSQQFQRNPIIQSCEYRLWNLKVSTAAVFEK